MKTTYKQQMAAIKKAMEARRKKIVILNQQHSTSFKLGHTDKYDFIRYSEDKQWIALNDAYTTLAAIALNESLNTTREKENLNPIQKLALS